ncbi:MAG: hypothetical protein P0Y53_01230 [Candidatus Pseudobacter hemicellulosilyticus]|uniref:Uncharacterized protein n=1 Tax=Candidatus Pseudobacter hemicellulosilyticus TaxID=3121375 RepID=A0AAJ6BFX1_9BACT|nr:MAG: hypothetical protein P0Y53_01230 [Pseudobacter sp.]
MKKQLPEFEQHGIIFQADVQNSCFRVKEFPSRQLSIFNMKLSKDGYSFHYGREERDMTRHLTDPHVNVRWLAHYDPEAMAAKYHKSLDKVLGKSDFDIIVNKRLLNRMLRGERPWVKILGETFEIAERLFSSIPYLRPRGSFDSTGIRLNDVDRWTTGYRLPYDPVLKQVQRLDMNSVTEIPENLVLIEIPGIDVLIPMGYRRELDDEVKMAAMRHPPKLIHEAKVIPWAESGILQRIEENRKRMEQKPAKKKGRKLRR